MEVEDKARAYRILLGLTVFVLAAGTVFYHFVEKFAWIDAYYFSVVTLTTVGYGDFSPQTNLGKIFTTFYLFIGLGIIATFASTFLKRRAIIYQQKHPKSDKQSK